MNDKLYIDIYNTLNSFIDLKNDMLNNYKKDNNTKSLQANFHISYINHLIILLSDILVKHYE